MSSRFSLRRLVKPAAYGAGIAAVGVTGMYMIYRPRNVPGAESLAPKPPRRDVGGKIIPPKFPYIKTRAEQIADLKKSSSAPTTEIYDLLVIGGGATGTGIALDAATRGLKVAIVERDDFSSGTSSKSTKLVHGGVRYLEKAVVSSCGLLWPSTLSFAEWAVLQSQSERRRKEG
jgi:glycerol-3-phosphate dehydrogenase